MSETQEPIEPFVGAIYKATRGRSRRWQCLWQEPARASLPSRWKLRTVDGRPERDRFVDDDQLRDPSRWRLQEGGLL